MAVETASYARLATYFPGETSDYPITINLDTGDSISSAKVSSVSSGVTLGNVSATASTTNGTVTFSVSSATLGEVFHIIVEAQTAGGRRWKRGVALPSGER